MFISIRKRYLRFLVPVFAALALLGLALCWLTGFGIRNAVRKPQPLSGLTGAQLADSYVTIPVEELNDTFSYLGYQDDSGQVVVRERYCFYLVEGKYLVIRVPEAYVPLLEKHDHAADLVISGEVGSLMEVDFGDLRGTINGAPNQKVMELLHGWISKHYVDVKTMTDTKTGADLRDYPGAAEGDLSAYLSQAVYPLQMEAGNWGPYPEKTVRRLSTLAAALWLLALGLAASVLCGMWEKPGREAVRRYGRKELEGEFRRSDAYGPRLRISDRYLWLFDRMQTKLLRVEDVIWTYPRSHRQEGGSLRWSLVLKTTEGAEYSVRLGDEALVQRAIVALQSKGYPLVLGFDKEKQKLFEKDLTTFRARARNKTL